MRTKFDEKKTTQLAALLLTQRSGAKRMHYIKLIKLLYLIDREALLRWGRPITYDNYVSMDKGPVLSRTLDLVTEEPMPGQESYWLKYISEPSNYEVELKRDPGQKELSDAEIELAKKVIEKFGKMDRWQLIDFVMHQLPEWEDPHGSAIPIEYKDILRAGGKTPQEMTAILDELEYLQSTKDILGND